MSGILQRKSGDLIFFPRIFPVSKWKTGKCREFQESKTREWLVFPILSPVKLLLQIFGQKLLLVPNS